VAQFIRVSSTQGQVPGRGNGHLAAGYLPITRSGVTKGLFEQAQLVAAAVAAQKAPPTPHQPPAQQQGNPPSGPSGPTDAPTDTPPATSPPAPAPASAPSKPPVTAAPVVTTAAVSSKTSGTLLVALLGIGIVASLGALAGRTTLWRKGLQWAQRP
jgi:hypothetical protein